MTRAEAQALQDQARAADRWLMWFIGTDADHPDKVVAWALTADPHGGTRHPGLLVADTLEELRAMLPPGLTRHERTPMMAAQVLEAWD